MALISDETIREVKRSVDITEVVSGYFPLKRAGSNYKALCPFHEEKTPSFNVHPEKQIFKCFGCGKAGDAISFVMAYEKVEYPDAIKILAEKAGIPIRYTEKESSGIGREEVYRANEWAAGVFRSLIKTAPEAEPARRFLARRGVSDETCEQFGLGFSMDSWDALIQRARRAGIGDRVLAAAGLAIERESKEGFYDRFRGRVMFPIGDARGKTIAFGARTLGDEPPKFINSPETAVFSKGRGFYGLHLAKEEVEKTGTIFIVEGYLDVIVPWQAGVRGLVATLGTALTRDHLKILRRYAEKVVLVFDPDPAGEAASERGLDLLLSENVDIFVAALPEGMDPDDVVMKQGPERLRECLERPREIFDFLLARLSAKHGGDTPAARQRIVEEMLGRLSLVEDEVKREILLQQLAQKFGLEERLLRGKLARREEEPAAAAPAEMSPLDRTACDLLACMLSDPAAAARVRREVPPERWPEGVLRRIAGQAYALFDKDGFVDGGDLVAFLREPAAMGAAAEIVRGTMDRETAERRMEECLAALERVGFRAESRERHERLKKEPGEVDKLLRETQDAVKRRKEQRGLMPGR